jgi:hypothetical protein
LNLTSEEEERRQREADLRYRLKVGGVKVTR